VHFQGYSQNMVPQTSFTFRRCVTENVGNVSFRSVQMETIPETNESGESDSKLLTQARKREEVIEKKAEEDPEEDINKERRRRRRKLNESGEEDIDLENYENHYRGVIPLDHYDERLQGCNEMKFTNNKKEPNAMSLPVTMEGWELDGCDEESPSPSPLVEIINWIPIVPCSLPRFCNSKRPMIKLSLFILLANVCLIYIPCSRYFNDRTPLVNLDSAAFPDSPIYASISDQNFTTSITISLSLGCFYALILTVNIYKYQVYRDEYTAYAVLIIIILVCDSIILGVVIPQHRIQLLWSTINARDCIFGSSLIIHNQCFYNGDVWTGWRTVLLVLCGCGYSISRHYDVYQLWLYPCPIFGGVVFLLFLYNARGMYLELKFEDKWDPSDRVAIVFTALCIIVVISLFIIWGIFGRIQVLSMTPQYLVSYTYVIQIVTGVIVSFVQPDCLLDTTDDDEEIGLHHEHL